MKINNYDDDRRKKGSIYKKWEQLRLSLVNIYNKKKKYKIKIFKKGKQN